MTTGDRMKARRKEIGLSAEAIAEYLGVSPATVYRYENGDIEDLPGSRLEPLATVLRTTPAYLMGWDNSPIPPGFSHLPATVRIPLIGSIACGDPIIAEENIEDYIDAPAECRPDFALRCRGDSMIEAGIEDGDLVYIRSQHTVNNGEIAAVRIGDEATLKYVYLNGDTLTLMPANKRMAPMIYSGEELSEIRIEGKAVGFTHWF